MLRYLRSTISRVFSKKTFAFQKAALHIDMDKYFEKIGMEWQYVLWSNNYPRVYKVGRSTQFNARIINIQATMSEEAGKYVHLSLFFKMPVFFAGASEKAIHKCMFWSSQKDMPGSGKTEWSKSYNIYAAAFFYLIAYAYGLPLWTSVVVALIPRPLDFALLTFLLAGIQYALAGLTFYGIWNIFF